MFEILLWLSIPGAKTFWDLRETEPRAEAIILQITFI